MKKVFILLAPILFISFFSCEDELVEPIVAGAEEVIQVDSEIYDLIQRVAGSAIEEEEEITCINFIYPLTLFTYDANLAFVNSQQISDDAEFSTILGSLEADYSISLSLPITTILDGGQTVNISSYEELKEAIDECMDNDFLQYCNGNLPSEDCVWKVIENGQDTGSYFSINDNGSTTYFDNGTTYIGTWVVLIIDAEVHLNINLEGNSETAIIWNHDWLITLTNGGDFLLDNGSDTRLLQKECDDNCNLTFEQCETNVDSGMAEFDLSSYTTCILSHTEVEDPTTVTVTFHITQADADANTNAIVGTFTNTENSQTIFVRVEDNTTGEATFISIVIEAISC